jgi:PQQ-dependent dehydrogenase (methanol/ethanol family)
MRGSSRRRQALVLCVVGILAVWLRPALRAQRSTTTYASALPRVDRATTIDWTLHNVDLSNSRYSPLAQIDTTNVARLTLAWSYDTGPTSFAQVTPLVVDGVMYLHSGTKLVALNAATGALVWTFDLEPAVPGGANRGPAFGDGRVYAFSAAQLYAVDAKTGKAVESFGRKGVLALVPEALAFKYPGKYQAIADPTTLGYVMTAPPTYHGGTLYVGVGQSDNHVAGGLVIAVDGATGTVRWVFNTIPQTPADEGWELAKDTWGTGARVGGGVWTQPAIDPELGLIYVNATNPAPAFDGSARIGMNLFTNSTIALQLATGKLAWHFQTLHHDLWDYDVMNGPILFDLQKDGRTVRGIAAAGKTCYVYMWDRQTGTPLNPIVETTVSTKTDVPGEQVWPTQPIPYTSGGVPQTPFCETYPILQDPALAARVRPMFTPYSSTEFYIIAPGTGGGANFGSPSFSKKTGLAYFSARNAASSSKIKPIGDTGRSGPKSEPFYENRGVVAESGAKASGTLTAYDPLTSRQVWQMELPVTLVGGNLSTAGNLVLQGTSRGDLMAIDATNGQEKFRYEGRRGIRASPLTYQVNGKQYIAIIATSAVLSFSLP